MIVHSPYRFDPPTDQELEIERLQSQNAVLLQAIESAMVAMTAAPLWHEQHRAAWAALQKLEEMK